MSNKAKYNPPKSSGSRNGKGDKPRPTDKSKFDKNYNKINWNKK